MTSDHIFLFFRNWEHFQQWPTATIELLHIDDLNGNGFESTIWINKIANGILNRIFLSGGEIEKENIIPEQTGNYMEDSVPTGNSASTFRILCDVFTHRMNFKLHSFDHRSPFFRFYFMVDRHLNIEYFFIVALKTNVVRLSPDSMNSISAPYSIPVLNELNLAQLFISHIMEPNKTFCWWIIPYLLRFRFNGIHIRRKVLCPLNDWCERIFQFSHENLLGIRPTSIRTRLFYHEGMIAVERKLCRELRSSYYHFVNNEMERTMPMKTFVCIPFKYSKRLFCWACGQCGPRPLRIVTRVSL